MDDEKTFEEWLSSVGKWFTTHITTIFAILISLFFIFSGTVKILPTELGVKEQIIVAIINIIAGYSITKLIGEQGFTSAKNNPEFIEVRKYYELKVKEAIKYRSAIDEFAKDKAKENLKNTRINLCESVGLYYSDIFDDDGNLIKDFDITKYKNDKNYRKKISRFNKCLALTIQDTSVFSKSGSSKFGITKRRTEKAYRTKSYAVSAITKLIFGIGSVGVMFVWIGFNLGSVIYAFMQIILWSAFGVIDRLKNYNFIIEEIMPQYIDDELIIEEFMKMSDSEKQFYINRTEKIKQIPYFNESDNNI